MTRLPEHYLHKDALSSDTTDRGTRLFVLFMAMLILAWISALLRAYVRVVMIKNVASEDWWMFASLTYTGYCVSALWGLVDGGTGKRTELLTLEETYTGLKAWYLCEVLYAPTSAMVRTSVALFLHRIASESLHKWIIRVNLGVVYLISTVFFFVVIFQCSPPRYFYEQVMGQPGTCMDIDIVPDVTIAHSAIGAACDLVFASLPIVMLWKVQLNKRTKVVIALLLSMGFVAGIALLVRIPYVKRLAITPDFLYETVYVAIWSVMEPSLGILAGCVATLRPLFKSLGFGKRTTQLYDDGPTHYSLSEGTNDRRGGDIPLT
ncbi:hypothetical protein VP1G_07232 [Cytospora mali]|uniref:Rhodopsin domain-containing protein n=1 Tax=Cytospora mali TaxID=578113 RepID=A0A194V7T1_CYTMA|nr:hypothetical protein VP1G_07232 [Valsa mali var. pyri (nom. inval.)]